MEILKEVSVALAYDNELNKEYYIQLLQKIEYHTETFVNLLTIEKQQAIKTDLLIIDISSKKSLLRAKHITFKKECKIIIVSPFIEKHLILPSNIKNYHYHSLTKPIDPNLFTKLLDSTILQVVKSRYLTDKKQLLIELVDKAPSKMAIFNKIGKLVYSNKDYLDTHNFILKETQLEFNSIVQWDISFQEIMHNLKTKEIFPVEKNYNDRWYKSYFYALNKAEYIAHIFYDITEDKRTLDNLKKTAMFFEQSSEGVLITDKDGFIITANAAFSKITGYTKDEAIGQSTNILASGIHERSFYENLWDHLHYHGKWQGEIWNKRKNGEVYPEWLSITQIKDDKTHEINYMALFTDISSIKEADKKLHFYAKHDHLTGLLNRVQFENMLNHSIERANRNKNMFALMYIDLDHFKEINDSYGHNVGDIVLKTVASRLKNTLRKEDIIARVGGDEFNIILEQIKDEADAISIATKLNEEIKKDIKINKKTFYLSLSVGISIYPMHGIIPADLIKNADSAMYEVKKTGRDGFLLYNNHFTKMLMHKVTLQNKLKKAIKKDEFEVYYQPVIDLGTNKILGAEALIRWEDKTSGFISPEEFIPIAEDHGMIFDLGQIVLHKSLEDLKVILNYSDNDFKLSINVSSREFFDLDYIDLINEKLTDFSISAKNIELEITETYIMKNHEEAIERLTTLKQLGLSLAIDDFGTGYSSLNYLKSFPIDKLKIDKSFILDILKNKDDLLIVETIINMAKIFKFNVQAEGIESKAHEVLLNELGCDNAQGYFYSKALPLNEFIEYIRQNNETK